MSHGDTSTGSGGDDVSVVHTNMSVVLTDMSVGMTNMQAWRRWLKPFQHGSHLAADGILGGMMG